MNIFSGYCPYFKDRTSFARTGLFCCQGAVEKRYCQSMFLILSKDYTTSGFPKKDVVTHYNSDSCMIYEALGRRVFFIPFPQGYQPRYLYNLSPATSATDKGNLFQHAVNKR